MYSYISGELRFKQAGIAIVENCGIGYKIHTTEQAVASLELGTKITLYTYLYVREDDLSLYGFLNYEDVALFAILLGVSGIGPRVSLSICSFGGAATVYGAIVSKDIVWLTKVPGVGKKTAERLVLELREKIV
ncbi:MAG: Holliday junction branch migration protein RuvA, partial [bacterium]|nr:Holliday junction branch migration protein RuvA [bacterium]